MAGRKESSFVGFLADKLDLVRMAFIPAMLGAFVALSIFEVIPNIIQLLRHNVPVDKAITNAYIEYYNEIIKLFKPYGEKRFRLIASPILGAIIGGFLYWLYKGEDRNQIY